jgi:hypothetical protein
MINSNQKTSILVPTQLPEFIRDNPDYSNFVLFIKAYYEWMEQNGQVTERSKNLLNYKDVDKTTSEFIDYFTNDFLPYFPKDVLVDEAKAVKFARELYQSKGTPGSYEFLFRVLYDSSFDIFYTRDAVLRASDGVWYVAKSLKLNSSDLNFLKTKNLRILGETTKSIATIENTVVAKNKIEVFISNIERLFQSGEFVRVVDNKNQDVLFNGSPLRAKIVGQISQILINPKNRGLAYKIGDPVIVYDGLSSNTGIGATAQVSEVTTGSVKKVTVLTGGQGFSASNVYPSNTQLEFTVFDEDAQKPIAIVGSLDPNGANSRTINFIASDTIALKKDIPIGNNHYYFAANLTANISCSLANALSFLTLTTYPLSSIVVTNGGGGITTKPSLEARSLYGTDTQQGSNLKNLGILGKIKVVNGGLGYQNNDPIVFTGGSGYGASARVSSVNAAGGIINVSFYATTSKYPIGGMGYKPEWMPSVTVNSANANATGAILTTTGILGDGATFDMVLDRAGSITKINVIDGGEDYIATPNVSIRVQDILVTNVSISLLPQKGEFVYQGNNANNTIYQSYADSMELLVPDVNPSKSLYKMRVYNYNAAPNPNYTIKIQNKNINFVMANTDWKPSGYTKSVYDKTGVRTYGDGTAKANASFLNGLVLSQGQYLNSQGRLSSFSKLESEDYNNYTYEITVQKEISKYRDVLLNLLHPTGMKLIGRYGNVVDQEFNLHAESALKTGRNLYSYTGTAASAIQIYADWTHKSNNILNFVNLSGANLANIIFANSTLSLNTLTGPDIQTEIQSIDAANNQVKITSNVWLTFMNVAYVSANAGSNVINIKTVTNSYDLVNNGNYSNTMYPMMDIVFSGDNIKIGNTVKQVDYVDIAHNKIYVANTFAANITNSLMSVNRILTAGGQLPRQDEIIIYGPVGTQYTPQLTTEAGDLITTEDGRILILG